MPRFYYEFLERVPGGWQIARRRYYIFDRRYGSDQYIAICDRHDDAETIVNALNAAGPK
ncbi:MAG: hypothetical protein ACXWLZ_00125 [Rhizomicrobium sp.]